MPQFPLSRRWGYGIAILTVVAATLARAVIEGAVGQRQPFVTYSLAVILSAWLGGLGPSILALGLGGLSGAIFFIPPLRSSRIVEASDWVAIGNYLVVGGSVVAFAAGQQLARRRKGREAERRLRAERELRASEGRFRQLAATIGDAFWMMDPAGSRLLYVSPAFEAIWGRPCPALPADLAEWLDGIHPDDRPRVEASILGAASRGHHDERYRVVRPDGTTRWVRDRGYPVRAESGEVVRLAGIAEDITEQRHTEQKALRLKALSDHASDALFVVGPDGAILDANEVACEWLGYDRIRLLTMGVPDIDPAYQLDRFRSLFDRALTERVPPFESALKRRDGSLIPVEVSAVVERFEGRPFLFSVVRDIAERKRTEEEIRRLNRQLGERVDELQTLLDILPVGVWQADPSCERLVGNRTACEMLGLPPGPDAFPGSSPGPWGRPGFSCVADGAEIPAEDLPMRRAARTARPVLNFEHEVVLGDGAVKSLICNAAPVLDGDGRVRSVLGAYVDISDRRRAEREMAGLAQRLTSLVDNTPLAVVEWDAEFRIARWSGQAENVFGWSAPEVLGRRMDEFPFIPEEDRAGVEAVVAGLLDPSNTYVVARNRNLTRSGEVVSCEWYNSVMHDEGGRMVAVLSLVLDVTERLRVERRLREERERVQLVADAVPALISYIDASARYRLNNRAYETWFALPREECLGRHMREVLGEQAWRAILPHVEAVLAGRVVTYEGEAPYRDGGTRWISATYTPDIGEGGEVRGFVAHVTDITDRHRREEELRASEARFRQLAEAMPQIVWVADPSGSNLYLSRRWTDFTGRSQEEGLSDRWVESIHPDDRPGLLASWEASVRAGTPYSAEYRLLGKDGSYRWHLVRGVPVRGDDGRIARWYGSSTDIDEPKRLAEALREADRRKDEFLATLAHELRNPLAPIRHAVALLRTKGPPDPELQWARDVIDRQAGTMARLLDDLLDVSRITTDKMELRRRPVDLDDAIRAAVETSRPLIEAGGHRLSVSLPPGPIVLDADPTRLAQIFSNLLNNAAKYSDEGGRIALTAARLDGQVVVSVKDDGIGIDAEHLSRIFEIFSQVEPALHRAQGGLGIGLALVRGLVQLHGGTVEARSDGPGMGSEFVVRLPASDATPAPSPAPTTPGRADGLPEAGCRVVLVDDNVDSARTLGRLLSIAGHEVRVAHDGPAGLETIERAPPDVAVLDIGLPGLDGYEVARRIRGRPWGAAMTLIALTGWGQQSDRRRSREAGFDHHLVKPIDPQELIALIGSACPRAAEGGR